jgi:hypothetical protein
MERTTIFRKPRTLMIHNHALINECCFGELTLIQKTADIVGKNSHSCVKRLTCCSTLVHYKALRLIWAYFSLVHVVLSSNFRVPVYCRLAR